jgi:hypothetical protein
MRSTQKVPVPGASARCQASFSIALELFTKTFLIGSINRVQRHLPIQKPSKKKKTNFRGQAIQELIFPAAKTDFEGGVDGRGCFD